VGHVGLCKDVLVGIHLLLLTFLVKEIRFSWRQWWKSLATIEKL